jgi:aspartyl-tRNA(Asn)/glutamyl-tRNA(Gln) amidotransferase subunit B
MLVLMKDLHKKYEVAIGLIDPVQLSTKSILLCADTTDFNASAISHINTKSTKHPGVFSKHTNKQIHSTVKNSLVLNCKITEWFFFTRKNYINQNLSKRDQIKTEKKPVCIEGFVPERTKKGAIELFRIPQIHFLKNNGMNIPHQALKFWFIALIRAGVSLLKIVSQPIIQFGRDVFKFHSDIRQAFRNPNNFDDHLKSIAIPFETNGSHRPTGEKKQGTRTGIQTLFSMDFAKNTIEKEITTQKRHLYASETSPEKPERKQKLRQSWNVKFIKEIIDKVLRSFPEKVQNTNKVKRFSLTLYQQIRVPIPWQYIAHCGQYLNNRILNCSSINIQI